MKRIFDRKISDRIIKGYDAEQIKSLLSNIREIDRFEFYYYRPHSKSPTESKKLKNQPAEEVLSFLNSHFTESSNFYVEIQEKVYKSGKIEVIVRGMTLEGEITKIAVLNSKKHEAI